jgi:hypothetical protein
MSHRSVPRSLPVSPPRPALPALRDSSTEAVPESAGPGQIVCSPDRPGPEYLKEVPGAASHPGINPRRHRIGRRPR